ncbi:MAG TPA: hypothetical protein VHV28_07375 [Solirubrobacteraceae bacterium]|jgi:hypothetical protein|nr:hypothetical protein [Solirubrobacteraceae bacterium]
MNRIQPTTRLFTLGSRHPQQVAWLRVVIGIWLLILTVVEYRSGHGGQWAWLLAACAVLHFGLTFRLFRISRNGV